jgi:hypothetical protein
MGELITLVYVEITLVRVEITLVRVEITLFAPKIGCNIIADLFFWFWRGGGTYLHYTRKPILIFNSWFDALIIFFIF